MKKAIRILRPLFFILFFVLVRQQALQIWLLLYLASLLFPALFGRRLYCTAACPINTLMPGIVWLEGKLGWLNKPMPQRLKSGWLAWASLLLSVALFIISRRLLGRDLPVMLFWMAAAVVFTLLFHPDVFHDLVCPYGVLQRLLAKVSLLSESGKEAARDYKGFGVSVLGAGKGAKAPGNQASREASVPPLSTDNGSTLS
ncbi:MAG: 4Fe-4S binding protein [Christensenellales bacterium]